MSKELLREKEESLAKYLFRWAQAHGLAEIPEQIEVSIKIRKNVSTYELDGQDWKSLLSKRFFWTAEEAELLKLIRDSGNALSTDHDDVGRETSIKYWQARGEVNLKLADTPYLVSTGNSLFWISKRLVTSSRKPVARR